VGTEEVREKLSHVTSKKGLYVKLIYLTCPKVQIGPGAHPTIYSVVTRVISPGVKRPGREVGHSSPYCTELENEWRYTAPPMSLHGVDGRELYF
jgi:hypothetical protein